MARHGYGGRVLRIDLSEPLQPIIVDQVATSGPALDVYVDGASALVGLLEPDEVRTALGWASISRY